jgi:hypothetical protein
MLLTDRTSGSNVKNKPISGVSSGASRTYCFLIALLIGKLVDGWTIICCFKRG